MRNSKWRKNIRLLKIIAARFGRRPRYLFLFFMNTFLGWLNSFFFLLDRILFPAMHRSKSDRPIFLIGHLRSGTTFLHRFLSANCKELRTFYLWEMIFPAHSLRMLIKPFLPLAGRFSLDKVYDPQIHKTGLRHEETDDIALYFRYLDGMLSWIYFHAWQEFRSFQDLEKSLLETCRQDKFISYLSRVYQSLAYPSRKRILSKSFSALYSVDTLKKKHPDARFIIIIRDPVEAIPSLMSLEESVQTKMHGRKRTVRNRRNYFRNLYQLSVHYYSYLDTIWEQYKNDPSVLFIAYEDLYDRFEETMMAILDHGGLARDKDLMEAIKEQSVEQAGYKSAHAYSLESFHLTEEKIRKEVPFYYRFIRERIAPYQNGPGT